MTNKFKQKALKQINQKIYNSIAVEYPEKIEQVNKIIAIVALNMQKEGKNTSEYDNEAFERINIMMEKYLNQLRELFPKNNP